MSRVIVNFPCPHCHLERDGLEAVCSECGWSPDMAKNKNLVAVYQRYWNSYVSPGEAVFAHRGAGERMVEEAVQNGMAPRGRVHEKEILV